MKSRRRLGRVARSLFTLAPAPGRTRQAAKWVAAVATGLVLSCLILGPQLGGLGLLGAMAAHTGRTEPMRRRIVLLLVVGPATFAVETVGFLTDRYEWLLPPVLATMTLVGMWVWHAFMIGPPGPINMLFAGAFGAYMSTHGYPLPQLLGVTALNWLFASSASVVILAVRPEAPLRDAVDTAETAVARYRDRPDDLGPGASNRLRSQANIAVHDAWQVAQPGPARTHPPRTRATRDQLERLKAVQLALVELLHEESFPSYNMAIADNFRYLPLGMPSTGYLLQTAWSWGSRPWLVAGRGAVAVLLASAVTILSPIGHPYWAVLSALIVLHMGASRADLAIRGVHRIVGTAVGVLVYFTILLAHPTPWTKVAIMVAAIFVTESVVTRNYALAVVFITTFALVMTPLSASMGVELVMRDRLVETVIGVTAAIMVIYLIGRHAPVLLVRRQYRSTLTSMVAVLGDTAVGDLVSRSSREHRCELVTELERSSAILSQQRPDDPRALARWRPLQEMVSTFGFDVITSCWHDLAQGDPAAVDTRRRLTGLIDSLPSISSREVDVEALTQRLGDIHLRFLSASHR